MIESGDNSRRKIIHVDMDAFFASVEQRDNVQLRGKPIAVGGSAKRGVVAAASYEARRFGVHSAMPSVTAARRCPSLIFVPPRFNVYQEVSKQIRKVFLRYTDLVEPLSLDEAYLDVTSDKQGINSAIKIACLIRDIIYKETALTASAGVSYNKFLAKVASDQNKPDGIFIIRPHEGAKFVASLPVRRFYGVGPKTCVRMAQLGIKVGRDLSDKSIKFLVEHFGKSAEYLYNAARGEDYRMVKPNRIRKSVGCEQTYDKDLITKADLFTALDEIVDKIWLRIEKAGVSGRTVTLKVKYKDFRQITRSKSCREPIMQKTTFRNVTRGLFSQIMPTPLGIRLLGLTLSSLLDLKIYEESGYDDPEGVGHLQGFFKF